MEARLPTIVKQNGNAPFILFINFRVSTFQTLVVKRYNSKVWRYLESSV